MELDEQIKILELMAQNEAAVAQLYAHYAQHFPQLNDFWTKLSKEEVEHAKIIRGLIPHVQQKTVFFNQDRFPRAAIESTLKYVSQEVARLKREKIPLMKALSIAFQIESSLIEKKYFGVFEGDNFKLKTLLNELRLATKRHVEMVETQWNLERTKTAQPAPSNDRNQ